VRGGTVILVNTLLDRGGWSVSHPDQPTTLPTRNECPEQTEQDRVGASAGLHVLEKTSDPFPVPAPAHHGQTDRRTQ
jgi:hypothetical protein